MAVKIEFYSGVGTVTGANFGLTGEESKFLIDCGLTQGDKEDRASNYKSFPYNPADFDFLFITHAHIDHIGRIPKLVKDGFKGTIYSTEATQELVKYMLDDAVNILQGEAKRDRIEPLYKKENVDQALSQWKSIPYHQNFKINDEFSVNLKDAGHILGSAMFEFIHTDSKKKVVFTGDLGNTPTPLLKNTDVISDANYLVMESVYGDRNHEDLDERKEKLKEVINRVTKRGGTLIIPVFSLEKTQVLLHELNDMVEAGEVEQVPVFLDSPLAIRLTEVYKREFDNFNEHVRKEIRDGDDIFHFPKLEVTMHQRESEAIHHIKGPKIIIAASGMSEGGRIMSHEKIYLPDENSALLFIGFQVAGSLGRAIKEGKKKIKMSGRDVEINAEIVTVNGYSSHKDSDGLLEFASSSSETLKKVFVVMGEPKSALFLAQKIRDNLDIDAVHPNAGDVVVLEGM